MAIRSAIRPAFLVLFLSLCSTALVSASPQAPAVALSRDPAVRAIAVSDPNPPPPPSQNALRLLAPKGQAPGDQFGSAVASAGDVNGDGYPDIIVGAWTADIPTGDAGSAYVFFGGPNADDVPDWTLRGQALGDNFGTSVAGAGDVNGDGYADVIVGAWKAGSSRTGRAYVFFGGPNPDTTPDMVLSGQALDDHFGINVAAADVNSDGFSDVVVGAPDNDLAGSAAGRAYVYFGGVAPDAVADLVLTGSAANDHLGRAFATGDFNGDGFKDLVVGADGSAGTGRAFLYLGGPSFDGVPDRTYNGQAPGDMFGNALGSAGDVNGDGITDLIIGAYLNDAAAIDAGAAYVFYGGPIGGTPVPDLVLKGERAADQFGLTVASAGDMNRDGFGDLVVGAWQYDGVGFNSGRAYVFFGGMAPDAAPDLVMNGEAAGDMFGSKVDGVGDFDRDGIPDVIVSAYLNDAGGGEAGRAYVFTLDTPRAPVVTAPTVVSANAGIQTTFTVTASDLNGDAIGVLSAAPLPSGATFTVNASNTVGSLTWTPSAQQVGSYQVTFTAANDLTGSATTRIDVTAVNLPPTLSPVSNMTVTEGTTADQALHATDPNGDPLTFTLAAGPGFASVTTVDATTGNLHLAPGFATAGTYGATVRASDGRGAGVNAALTVTVVHANRAPVLSVPGGVFGSEGVAVAFTITATDADGDHVTLGIQNRPLGSLFIDNGNSTGSFSWTPGFEQAGSYNVTFTGRDDLGAVATPRTTTITVDDLNRGPTAAAGGPYAGVVNVPIAFNGTGSSDPDGTPLTYSWDFGDLSTGAGVTPSHAYGNGGTFTVTLTVSDGLLSDGVSTIATVQDVFPARAFTTSSNAVIRLGSGRTTWCAEIEPVDGSFVTTSVLVPTIAMKYGTGTIVALAGKASLGGDKDGNGITEVTACFSKTDLRTLFAGLGKGTTTVTVTLEGQLSSGGTCRTTLTLDVVKSGGGLTASLSPNPLNPTAVLTFLTTKDGPVRVSIFDLQGRLVRHLQPEAFFGAGYHDLVIDGRGERGERLPSGAYLYRVEAAEGTITGRFLIVK